MVLSKRILTKMIEDDTDVAEGGLIYLPGRHFHIYLIKNVNLTEG